MKYARQRKRYFGNEINLALIGIFDGISPFGESLSDLIYGCESLCDDQCIASEALPPLVESEIFRLCAVPQAQLVACTMPGNTWASGIRLGLMRQNIAQKLESYWRENGEFPSGTFRLDDHRVVQLPDRHKGDCPG